MTAESTMNDWCCCRLYIGFRAPRPRPPPLPRPSPRPLPPWRCRCCVDDVDVVERRADSLRMLAGRRSDQDVLIVAAL